MKNPWKDISDAAFDPMFDETIAVKTVDGKTTSFAVAMFTDGMSDTLTEDMMDTNREDVTFVFKKQDWPFVQTLKRGAVVIRCSCDKSYSVSEAKLDNCFGWVVTAREK